MVQKIEKKIEAKIGGMSMVAVSGSSYPLPFGNYFDFASGERCLNMWAENFEKTIESQNISHVGCTVFSEEKHRCMNCGRSFPISWSRKQRVTEEKQ